MLLPTMSEKVWPHLTNVYHLHMCVGGISTIPNHGAVQWAFIVAGVYLCFCYLLQGNFSHCHQWHSPRQSLLLHTWLCQSQDLSSTFFPATRPRASDQCLQWQGRKMGKVVHKLCVKYHALWRCKKCGWMYFLFMCFYPLWPSLCFVFRITSKGTLTSLTASSPTPLGQTSKSWMGWMFQWNLARHWPLWAAVAVGRALVYSCWRGFMIPTTAKW